MKNVVFYGSRHCEDCADMKEFLSKHNVKYVFVDISENMPNLKAFLKYRDNRSEFDEIKNAGRVGIPCLVVNDGEKLIFEESLDAVNELKEQD